MSGRHLIGRERGSLPGGSPRNGLSGGRYRYRKFEKWYPEEGVHLDPEAVLPQAPATVAGLAGPARGKAVQKAAYEERLAAFAVLDADGVRWEEIERLTGWSRATQGAYRRVLRDRAVQAAEYRVARDLGYTQAEAAYLGDLKGDAAGRCEREYQEHPGAGP